MEALRLAIHSRKLPLELELATITNVKKLKTGKASGPESMFDLRKRFIGEDLAPRLQNATVISGRNVRELPDMCRQPGTASSGNCLVKRRMPEEWKFGGTYYFAKYVFMFVVLHYISSVFGAPEAYVINNKCYENNLKIICENATTAQMSPSGFSHNESLECRFCDIPVLTKHVTASLQNVHSLAFDSGNMDAVDENALDDLRLLKSFSLKGNNIHLLPKNLFKSLPELYNLDLQSNKIADLDENVFQSQFKLELLNLNGNRLSSLGSKVFGNLESLVQLDLGNNKIATINNTCFNSLKKLKYLNLSANSLESVPDHLFSNLTKLHSLDLSYNRLLSVKLYTFSGLSNLDTLNLAHNKLTTILEFSFKYLTNTTKLQLEYNAISELKSGTFQGLDRLNLLSLQKNNLTKMALTAFQPVNRLDTLNISHNPLPNLPLGVFTNFNNLKTLDISFLPLQNFSKSVIFPLHNLHTLLFDTEYVKDEDFHSFLSEFYQLREVFINNANWPCAKVLELCRYCKENNIKTASIFEVLDRTNIHGIYCTNGPVIPSVITTTSTSPPVTNYTTLSPTTSTTENDIKQVLKEISEIKNIGKGNLILEVFVLLVTLTILMALLYVLFLRNRFSRSTSERNIVDDSDMELINS